MECNSYLLEQSILNNCSFEFAAPFGNRHWLSFGQFKQMPSFIYIVDIDLIYKNISLFTCLYRNNFSTHFSNFDCLHQWLFCTLENHLLATDMVRYYLRMLKIFDFFCGLVDVLFLFIFDFLYFSLLFCNYFCLHL